MENIRSKSFTIKNTTMKQLLALDSVNKMCINNNKSNSKTYLSKCSF